MSKKEVFNDYPFEEICEFVENHIHNGCTCYQKFTCSNCGQRLTIDIPNVLYTSGTCDKCEHVTDIAKQGCNYLLIAGGNYD